jgi:hypothetical protein
VVRRRVRDGGLLNIVPRYLPRYGMAPEWTRAVRPLVLVWTAIAFVVTLLFRADVVAQSGAYATGVLVLISSAAIAVTLSARHRGQRLATVVFGVITLLFAYTTVANILERPDGVKIASVFIAAIVTTSLISRVSRCCATRSPIRGGARRYTWRDDPAPRPVRRRCCSWAATRVGRLREISECAGGPCCLLGLGHRRWSRHMQELLQRRARPDRPDWTAWRPCCGQVAMGSSAGAQRTTVNTVLDR